jgi:hypothetical protein
MKRPFTVGRFFGHKVAVPDDRFGFGNRGAVANGFSR